MPGFRVHDHRRWRQEGTPSDDATFRVVRRRTRSSQGTGSGEDAVPFGGPTEPPTPQTDAPDTTAAKDIGPPPTVRPYATPRTPASRDPTTRGPRPPAAAHRPRTRQVWQDLPRRRRALAIAGLALVLLPWLVAAVAAEVAPGGAEDDRLWVGGAVDVAEATFHGRFDIKRPFLVLDVRRVTAYPNSMPHEIREDAREVSLEVPDHPERQASVGIDLVGFRVNEMTMQRPDGRVQTIMDYGRNVADDARDSDGRLIIDQVGQYTFYVDGNTQDPYGVHTHLVAHLSVINPADTSQDDPLAPGIPLLSLSGIGVAYLAARPGIHRIVG